MFGISGGELIVIIVSAIMFMGPKNVAQLMGGIRKAIQTLRGWSASIRGEMAVDLTSLGLDPKEIQKLKGLDLRQYDPRQMVREAVQEEMAAWIAASNDVTKVVNETARDAIDTVKSPPLPEANARSTQYVRTESPADPPERTVPGNDLYSILNRTEPRDPQ